MAFGTIKALAPSRSVPPIPARSDTPGTTVTLDIPIIAHSAGEASDYLCGIYFALQGRRIHARTHSFSAISQLAQIKQDLEEATRQKIGTNVRRQSEGSLRQCQLTVGLAADPTLSLALQLRSCLPGSAVSGDLAIALVNFADPAEETAKLVKACASLPCPVLWVICGFEARQLFWSDDPIRGPQEDTLAKFSSALSLPRRDGDILSLAQLYGGLIFRERQGGDLLCQTHSTCREYLSVGCQMGLLAAIHSILQTHTADGAASLAELLEPILESGEHWFRRGQD